MRYAARQLSRFGLVLAAIGVCSVTHAEGPTTEPAATQPSTPTSAPAADEVDALNKQRLAEQLDAEARDRLGVARARLQSIESDLENAAADGLDTSAIEDEHAYWKRIEECEQRRLGQAELQKRAAKQKEAIGRLRARADELRKTRDELARRRSKMTQPERHEQAAQFKEQAEAARQEAAAFEEQALAVEPEIEPLQQLLVSVEALEAAMRERLDQAADFDEYQRRWKHYRRMRRQYDIERQQIDLMLVTTENIAYAKRRQATLAREIAGLHGQCADTLVPPVPPFRERHRKIINSIGIVWVH